MNDTTEMKTFDVRVVIHHVGDGGSSIPATRQPEFVSMLEQGEPTPRQIDWSDLRHSNQTVVTYTLEAQTQFEAVAAGRRIFEQAFKPRLHEFQAALGALEAEEVRR